MPDLSVTDHPITFEALWIEWARITLVAEGPDAAVAVLGFYLALNPPP